MVVKAMNRIPLKNLLERHGYKCYRFDMSKIIPQKRIRLICIKIFDNTLDKYLG